MSHIKKEYILVKKGHEYYYARLNLSDPDLYVVLTHVTELEGREIIERANAQSEYTAESYRLDTLINHKEKKKHGKKQHS